MEKDSTRLTRRDFMKGFGSAALGVAAGLPAVACAENEARPAPPDRSKVVLIRNENVVMADGSFDARVLQQMLDEALVTLFELEDAAACWRQIVQPEDVVGIKTNVWPWLPTPPELNDAIRSGVLQAGVQDDDIATADRGLLQNDTFMRSTVLINTRPMRTHSWSGVGSLIKNYITFVPRPSDYHYNACGDLAALWDLPVTRGKTRLNVLVMLTPQFNNVGPHHFDPSYIWPYGGLIVSTDPVAADSFGLRIIQEKRRLVFGEDRPLQPTAHHIALADTVHHLGNADPGKIDLVKLGWEGDILI
jgi:hypothetical protein